MRTSYDVFISYSHEDAETAREIKRRLDAAGAPTFRDRDCIRPGDDWNKEIEAALERADVVLLLLSPGSCVSDSVHAEINEAMRLGKQVLKIALVDPRHLIGPLAADMDQAHFAVAESDPPSDDDYAVFVRTILEKRNEALHIDDLVRAQGRRGRGTQAAVDRLVSLAHRGVPAIRSALRALNARVAAGEELAIAEDETRGRLACLLGRIGARDAATDVAALLDDGGYVSIANVAVACEALASIGGPEAIEAVRAVADRHGGGIGVLAGLAVTGDTDAELRLFRWIGDVVASGGDRTQELLAAQVMRILATWPSGDTPALLRSVAEDGEMPAAIRRQAGNLALQAASASAGASARMRQTTIWLSDVTDGAAPAKPYCGLIIGKLDICLALRLFEAGLLVLPDDARWRNQQAPVTLADLDVFRGPRVANITHALPWRGLDGVQYYLWAWKVFRVVECMLTGTTDQARSLQGGPGGVNKVLDRAGMPMIKVADIVRDGGESGALLNRA